MDHTLKAVNVETLAKEPWVKLASGSGLDAWTHEREIAYNQANRQAQKLAFFVNAFDFLTENRIVGDYHEYGCHRARTFRMALTEARRHHVESMHFLAFDSFEGLPGVSSDPAHPLWKKGALSTSEEEFWRLIEEHRIYVDRCRTIKGFYQATLTTERQAEFLSRERMVALACIDCDLYESAAPVFRFIEPLLQEGSLLYLDDFFVGYKGSPVKGVVRAFGEFQERSRFKFAPHMQVGWWGRSFIAYLEGES